MGEVADMIIDGTLCQECGMLVYEGNPLKASDAEVSPGFPRTCRVCLVEAKAENDAEPCPECSTGKLRGASGGGVKCNNPDCWYWFCF